MIADDLGQRLHDLATRGASLSAEEQAQLAEWYAQQDADETALLDRAPATSDLDTLRAQVAVTVAQLQALTQRIQTLTVENDQLRQEIAALKHELTQSSVVQSA